MSKLLALSLKLVERLEEMGLVPEEAEEYVEDVEENLEDSLERFYSVAEDFLANDFGNWKLPENVDKLTEKLSLLLRRVRRFSGEVESLDDVVGHAFHFAMKYNKGK